MGFLRNETSCGAVDLAFTASFDLGTQGPVARYFVIAGSFPVHPFYPFPLDFTFTQQQTR